MSANKCPVTMLLCCLVAACAQHDRKQEEPSGDPAVDGQSASDSETPTNRDASEDDPEISTTPDAPDDDPNVLWREGDCAHPRVTKSCQDGWCAIPAGCFFIGSPEDELGRGKYSEDLTQVTLTRPFHIQQHNVTCAEWNALGLKTPVGEERVKCRTPAHPLANINWYEALMLANLVSERHDPPVPPCYRLMDCEGAIGDGLTCKSVEQTTPTIYECEGFRLPTEYEWEYAARAGTRTVFYNGGYAPETTYQKAYNCDGERNLEPIAWFCANSKDQTHPVGQKIPNAWGLHDMLGNVEEWTNGPTRVAYRPSPLVDPDGPYIEYPNRCTRGCLFMCWPSLLRCASDGALPMGAAGPGVRLVRTGTTNPGPLPGSGVAAKGVEAKHRAGSTVRTTHSDGRLPIGSRR